MATRTRTRKSTAKSTAKNGKGDDAKAKAAAKKAADKKAAEKQAAAEKREAKKVAAQEAKEQKRQDAIDAGELIVDGDREFNLVDPKDKKHAAVDQRTAKIVKLLQESDVPVAAKEIHEKMGGAYALAIPVYSTLKALGLISEFRMKSGERGGTGVAYLWNDEE